jgi:hypothetical protein
VVGLSSGGDSLRWDALVPRYLWCFNTPLELFPQELDSYYLPPMSDPCRRLL